MQIELKKANTLILILDSLKKITELELEVQEQSKKITKTNYNTSYIDRLKELSKKEKESRKSINFESSLEEIDRLIEKHKQALKEYNEHLKSIWRVKE